MCVYVCACFRDKPLFTCICLSSISSLVLCECLCNRSKFTYETTNQLREECVCVCVYSMYSACMSES